MLCREKWNETILFIFKHCFVIREDDDASYLTLQLSQQLSWHIKLTRLMLKSFCCYFAQSLWWTWMNEGTSPKRWTLLRKCLLINYSDYVLKCFWKIGQLVFLMMIKVSLNEWCQTLLLDLQKLLSRLLINLGNS